MKTLIGLTLATMLILLMKIVNSITWIQNHILQIHDEYNKLRRISDDIYTQGLRITTSIDEIGDDPNAEEFTDDEAMLDA
jgi:hypothetical protein